MTGTSKGSFLLLVLLVISILLIVYAPLLMANDSVLEVSVLPRPATGVSEYVELTLTGKEAVDLSGWYIMDELSSPSVVFTFPTSTILSSQSPLRVCQGALANTPVPPCQFHFGGTAKWNNDGDTLRLFNATGSEILVISYGSTIAVGEVLRGSATVASEDDEVSDDDESNSTTPDEQEEAEDNEEEPGAEDGNTDEEDGNQAEEDTDSNDPNTDEEGGVVEEEIEEEVAEEDDEEVESGTDNEGDNSAGDTENNESGNTEDDSSPESDENSPTSPQTETVLICKATNNPRRPYLEVRVPVSSLVTRHGITNADIVPAHRHRTGRNIRERYLLAEGKLSGAQILYRRCEVSRPQPYRGAMSHTRFEVRYNYMVGKSPRTALLSHFQGLER